MDLRIWNTLHNRIPSSQNIPNAAIYFPRRRFVEQTDLPGGSCYPKDRRVTRKNKQSKLSNHVKSIIPVYKLMIERLEHRKKTHTHTHTQTSQPSSLFHAFPLRLCQFLTAIGPLRSHPHIRRSHCECPHPPPFEVANRGPNRSQTQRIHSKRGSTSHPWRGEVILPQFRAAELWESRGRQAHGGVTQLCWVESVENVQSFTNGLGRAVGCDL